MTTYCSLAAEGLAGPGDRCVGLVWLPEQAAVLLALTSGALLEVAIAGPGQIEEVGSVGCGLACLAVSPDQELLALVTGELSVLTMTRSSNIVLYRTVLVY